MKLLKPKKPDSIHLGEAALQGWRLGIKCAVTSYTRYFPDKKFGDSKKILAAAEKTLAVRKVISEIIKRVMID